MYYWILWLIFLAFAAAPCLLEIVIRDVKTRMRLMAGFFTVLTAMSAGLLAFDAWEVHAAFPDLRTGFSRCAALLRAGKGPELKKSLRSVDVSAQKMRMPALAREFCRGIDEKLEAGPEKKLPLLSDLLPALGILLAWAFVMGAYGICVRKKCFPDGRESVPAMCTEAALACGAVLVFQPFLAKQRVDFFRRDLLKIEQACRKNTPPPRLLRALESPSRRAFAKGAGLLIHEEGNEAVCSHY